MEENQNSFSGWAIVEMMGHRQEIGYVTTEHYGAAALFRVDSPGLEEREFTLDQPQWIRDGETRKFAPAGCVVRRMGIDPRSCLVGPASIYALNPCTEAAARFAMEQRVERPLMLLSVPENAESVQVRLIGGGGGRGRGDDDEEGDE